MGQTSKKKGSSTSARRATAPKFTAAIAKPTLKAGEELVGAFIDASGKGHWTILLPGDESGTHAEMTEWAKKQGGDLPDRVEQAMLFRDHQKKFERDWYWSNALHAGHAGCAWFQYFGSGLQDWNGVSNRFRARAVRRVSIS